MATLPSANLTLVAGASAGASGDDLLVLIAPVATSADATPRQYGSADAIYDQHGYSEAVEYASIHFSTSALPLLMIGIPIATQGAVSREDTTGNTGTSTTTLTPGSSGVLADHDGVLSVATGGTIGTDDIILTLSMDGGLSTKKVRLGTASSYVIPYFGVTVSFGAGTLVAGDTIHTWSGSGPRADSAGWTSAFTAMKARQGAVRSFLFTGDAQTDTEVSAILTNLEDYETNDRWNFGRIGVLDRLPLASMSNSTHRMSSTNVTFAEVGVSGDTITRASGSWASDGFATGDLLTITGSVSNNISTATTVTVTSSTVITLGTDDLEDEGPVANVSIVGVPSLTFSDSADTITRAGGSPGSWVTDGFRVGDSVTVSGTVSNDGTYTVTAVTATVLTLEVGDLADEVIGITAATITAGQTKAAWMAAITTEFAPIDDKELISLSAGKARAFSLFSNWFLRWPAAWAATSREYQHDLHTPTWRKSDGPTGWILHDSDGALVEWDDRADGGGASAARFTSFRTYANGPNGAFIGNDLTRATDASLLVQTHNIAVVNRARTVCHAATEAAIGRSLILNADGTATKDAIAEIESFVNNSLALDMLVNKRGEGPRVSNITWTMSTDDVLNVAEPIVTGVLTVYLRGAIHTINTSVVVQ
jgi:hypothetical protein